MKTGKSIVKIRESFFKMSQNEFSRMIGVTESDLIKYESDEAVPAKEIIESISNISGVTTSIIVYLGLEREDVQDSKKDLFDMLKPVIDELIGDVMDKGVSNG